jgi:hypothetical protein
VSDGAHSSTGLLLFGEQNRCANAHAFLLAFSKVRMGRVGGDPDSVRVSFETAEERRERDVD